MMATLLNRLQSLRSSAFARDVGGLLVLTALGQVAFIATAPFLGRLFTPDDFGLYGLFYSYVVTVAIFSTLNYDLAVPAADNDVEADGLSRGALQVSLLLSCAFGGVAAVLSFFDLLGFGDLPWWAGALMAVTLLLQAVMQIQQAWQIRRQTTIEIGKSGLSLNFTRAGVQLGTGFAGLGWIGLGLAEAVGRLITAIHLSFTPSRWLPRLKDLTRIPFDVLRKYRRFPVVLLPAQGLDVVVMFSVVVGLTSLFGAAGLGQWFLMRRTLDVPVAFAFRSLGDVFYGRMAAIVRETPSDLPRFYLKAFLALLACGLLVGAPVMAFGPALFRFVFGGQWGEAGLLAAVTMPSVIMNLAVAPASRVFSLTRRAGLRYVFSGVHAIGSAGVILWGHLTDASLIAVVAGLSVAITVSYAAYFAAGLAASRRPIEQPGAAA
jgi:O-antigen/teichoic acid export membrane protein